MMISLMFPNERLHIYELMTERGISGSNAIIERAKDIGLISSDTALPDLRTEPGLCECMQSVRKILYCHFKNPDLADEVWMLIRDDFRKYQSATNRSNRKENNSAESCMKDSQILYDLMLQQIGRYS